MKWFARYTTAPKKQIWISNPALEPLNAPVGAAALCPTLRHVPVDLAGFFIPVLNMLLVGTAHLHAAALK